jgi:hypothetical protein
MNVLSFISKRYGVANRRGWTFAGICVLPVLVFSFISCKAMAGDGVAEYQVKAAFLFNFAKFVEWRGEVAAGDEQELNICILGNDPFGGGMDAFKGKSVKNRRLVVRKINGVEELEHCQILFISSSEKEHLSEILTAVARSPVLTVSDIKYFAQTGGVIGFVTVDEHIRFDINQATAERAGLQISSQLLKLARSVEK